MAASAPAWEDGGWQPLPALSRSTGADVCVVGLGGSGLAAVLAAREAGLSVVGIDAGRVAGGAAGRNGGFLLAGLARFHHEVAASVGQHLAAALYGATLTEIGRMQAQTPAHVRLTGSLRIADTPEEQLDCEAHLSALRRDGFAAELYEGPEGRGLLIPTDGVFNPLARARSLALQAMQDGALLFEHTRAVTFDTGRVTMQEGTIECGLVIVAVDGRLEASFPELRDRIRTARLQMLATEPTTEVALRRPVYARRGYDYWQQLPDGRVLLGGARDRAAAEEWTHEDVATQRVQQHLDALLRERLGIRARVTHRWAASVGYTPTGLPLVLEWRPRVWLLGGYNGTGNVVGSLCARAVVERHCRGRSELLELLHQAAALARSRVN